MTENIPVIDYVLFYEFEATKFDPYAKQRMDYLKEVQDTGLHLEFNITKEEWNQEAETRQKVVGDKYRIIKIYAPFELLSETAERLKLKMPLTEGVDVKLPCRFERFMTRFATEVEVNFISAHYEHNKRHLFRGIENQATFFRPAIRSLLVHYILTNIAIEIRNDDAEATRKVLGKVPALPYLLMKKAFKSAFILHDLKICRDSNQLTLQDSDLTYVASEDETKQTGPPDGWTELNNLWANTYLKFQPLWKIRNYFGEKIALYFAVMETLLISLIIPVLLGVGVFAYGLYCSISCYNASNNLDDFLRGYNYDELCQSSTKIGEVVNQAVNRIRGVCNNIAGRKIIIAKALNTTCTSKTWKDADFQISSDDLFTVIQSSFDNDATPWFGLVICLWGTIFVEMWKRVNAKLVYEWDVENFENDEPARPEFYGTNVKKDPVTGEIEPYYPGTVRRTKMLLSLLVGALMVCWVFASLVGVVIYKTWARLKLSTSSPWESFLLTTVSGSLLNVVSIIILAKVYHRIAIKMTDWENHRTQTNYNDALILKLFAFHFANSYSSLFYIAFLRKNNQKFFQLLGLTDFEDNCGALNNCMSELSIQVVILMIFKLFPKLLTDVFIPWFRKTKDRICSRIKIRLSSKASRRSTVDDLIKKESKKPDLGDFTLEEYTEKIIQYGYQMLFSISFPLAPLLFFITILCDIRVDAKRLLWMYKRPIAFMAQDIGQWLTILDLINGVAVITNACVIAFNTDFARDRPFYEQLIILIVIEHIVFVVKFLLATIIPDIPQHVLLAMRKEKHQVATKMRGYPKVLHQVR
ncbi:anoctamin-7-like isoform X2 [Scyliorhinus canicula]|uniref:anoctamin-7-like isoform X2 n=1 Tax=Scyliorhinus canicula TaxID=7830 RepID=UPI0018F2DB7F|nr:anoctamin-7-like isoform X2 [Scyliorhinus canicula]